MEKIKRKHVEIGKTYGYLTVIEEVEPYIHKNSNGRIGRWPRYRCLCNSPYHKDPVEVIRRGSSILRDAVCSCGCAKIPRTQEKNKFGNIGKHHKSQHEIYDTWLSMIDRCYKPFVQNYQEYGERGIKICREWYNPDNPKDIDCFRNFFNWSYIYGHYKEGCRLSIDRIDHNGNYEPSNCIWTNSRNQNNNKRNSRLINFNSGIYTIAQIAYILGIDYHYLDFLLRNNNYDISCIFSYINTPYGLDPRPVIKDRDGNIIPIHAIYFLDSAGYPINETEYIDNINMNYGMFWIDSNGFILGPMNDKPKPKDITIDPIIRKGDIFGKLTVIEEDSGVYKNKNTCLCKCECGNIKKMFISDIRNGKTSCGECTMIKIGDTFNNGLLKIIERVDNYISPKGKMESRYKCLKFDGNTYIEKIMRSSEISTNYIKDKK